MVVKPYSMDLRERIVCAVLSGGSQNSVAAQFGVCVKTVQRYVQRHHQGELSPRKPPGATPRVSAQQEPELIALMQERSDWTLESMAEEWERRSGVRLPRSTFHDHLVRLGGRYKKRVALPKSDAKSSATLSSPKSSACR